ncbi:hypothetical protein [Paenibacillus polymyxa]|uniref:hypothetical protein n=1 Tax=Paenibacillus polymyxa TaxID=1406 RepID=UPI0007EBD85E|nr:hypothetical protein [Paenibacillus polymyxa]OAZ49047.1 hypothetical protein A9Z39_13475 [Paenibacillus polymyxa]
MEATREELIKRLKDTQMEVERLLFSIKQNSTQGRDYFIEAGNHLADMLFDIRTNKDVKINSLRSKATDLLKKKDKFFKDYAVFCADPIGFNKRREAEAAKVEKRGGARKGAGRKSLGIKKSVTITLPQERWDEIDSLIKNGKFKSSPDYFRHLDSKDSKD